MQRTTYNQAHTNKTIDLLLATIVCVLLMNQTRSSMLRVVIACQSHSFIHRSRFFFPRDILRKKNYPFSFCCYYYYYCYSRFYFNKELVHTTEEWQALRLLKSRSSRYRINLFASVDFFLTYISLLYYMQYFYIRSGDCYQVIVN
jgi:hypothetical protein